ncbi:MAG: STAS domain-containing protein [Chitinophagaceae bacterium]|jgi:anti-anti-sigma regulatory factor
MEIKIDTKEKFTVITPVVPYLADNMANNLIDNCKKASESAVNNVILNLQHVSGIDINFAAKIATLQQNSYEENKSFVVCCMIENVEKVFEEAELLEFLNATPTESEAWDIVQMEEIERELLDDFEKDN